MTTHLYGSFSKYKITKYLVRNQVLRFILRFICKVVFVYQYQSGKRMGGLGWFRRDAVWGVWSESSTTSYRFPPICNGGTPSEANASEWRDGDVAVPQSKTYWLCSVFFFAVAKSGLFDRSFTFHLYSGPRDETVIDRLRSLSAYYRLVFPGLDNVY